MKKLSPAGRLSVLALLLPLLHGCAEPGKSNELAAGNVAIVNGKPVPKARVDALLQQATRGGQPVTPELEAQVKDEVVLREMFMQEAESKGLARSDTYKAQMELARQSILIRELFNDFNDKNPVTDAEIQAEYDKFKAQNAGTEFRARHILVEKEDQARALIKELKAGAKFEDLAKKHSKDTGSGMNGGDLDWANPNAYVPEFAQALSALKKGQMTDAPVKTQFGYHVIKLEDTREAEFPSLEEVKPRIQQALQQQKLAQYRESVRTKARTDHKFSQ